VVERRFRALFTFENPQRSEEALLFQRVELGR
jgi:hypothetical protein